MVQNVQKTFPSVLYMQHVGFAADFPKKNESEKTLLVIHTVYYLIKG